MNSDRIQGNWNQVKGRAKEQWGLLTDNELDVIDGQREQLVGKLQEKYGIGRNEAERQVSAFETMHTHDFHAAAGGGGASSRKRP